MASLVTREQLVHKRLAFECQCGAFESPQLAELLDHQAEIHWSRPAGMTTERAYRKVASAVVLLHLECGHVRAKTLADFTPAPHELMLPNVGPQVCVVCEQMYGTATHAAAGGNTGAPAQPSKGAEPFMVEGRVAFVSASGRGFKLDGDTGWWNFARTAPAVPLQPGHFVRFTPEKGNQVGHVEVTNRDPAR